MPTHKGIKLTIVSQLEFQVHPEFAHPESSQFTNRSPDLRGSPEPKIDARTPPSTTLESKADRLLGKPSAISVYIPSVPGARFWLRYSLDDEAAGNSPWYYFKLFMNGRLIAAWGTHSKSAPSGQVMRGLFEPSEKWNYRYEGQVFKNMGTETRPFYFAKGEEARSVANDGGLIEVLVCRAFGRQRKMPEPPDWKPQDEYGIVMPSSGLFENPQDAKYYDYHLMEPPSNPYGRFRFHYRSWDNLESLQLIPSSYPRRLLAPSASILSLNGLSRELQAQLQESDSEEEEEEEEQPELSTKSSFMSQVSDTPWLTTVFDDVPDEAPKDCERRGAYVVPPEVAPLYPRRTESVTKSKFALAIVDKPTTSPPQESPWKEYLDRPLPEIPSRHSSLRHSQLAHSRKSSSTSNTASITPSLLQYLDRDTLSPEPEFGIASAVPVTSHTSPVLGNRCPDGHEGAEAEDSSSIDSASDNLQENALPQSVPPRISSKKLSKRSIQLACSMTSDDEFSSSVSRQQLCTKEPNLAGKAPPPLFASLSNITLRKNRQSPPKTPHKPPGPQLTDFNSPLPNDDQPALIDNTTTLSLSESEWMCRTPSPVKEHPALQENQSPLTATKAVDLEMGSLLSKSRKDTIVDGNRSLRKKAFGWYEKMRERDTEETSVPAMGGNFENIDDKLRMPEMGGNWI